MNIQNQEILLEFFSQSAFKTVIHNSDINTDVIKTIQQCFDYCYNKRMEKDNNKIFEIESVIDYLQDELNTGHWSEVPIQTRQLFTCTSFLKCIVFLKSEELSQVNLKKCLKCLDMGLVMGAPIDFEPLQKSATYLSKLLHELENTKINVEATKRRLNEEYYDSFRDVNAQEISTEECPNMEYFNKSYFTKQIPAKLTGK